MKLERRYVEKPWGRTRLPPMFDAPEGKRIGELWFTGAGEQLLLVKYLFTSERLSIQVHPNDEQARAQGLHSGKSECWYIVEAEPDAEIGLGLKRAVSADALREAALDGSIEQLLDWRRVGAGDFFFVPPGTIHAIGGGIALLELQQNSDVTYRLYDYGRPRELHVGAAVAVAKREPYPDLLAQHLSPAHSQILIDGPHFIVAHCIADELTERQRWVIPLEGRVRDGEDSAGPGDCLLVQPGQRVEGEGRMLIGATA